MTTSIRGDAISDMCVRRAGMLNTDIYDRPRSILPDPLKPYWDINKSGWEVREEWRKSPEDGFLARLHVPRAQGAADLAGLCPPVLCFRGSDGEGSDFEEMAVGMRLQCDFLYDLWNGGVTVRQAEDVVIDHSVSHGVANLNGRTMVELDAVSAGRGWRKEWLFNAVPGRYATQIGRWRIGRADLTLTWTASAALCYGTSGDRAVNFAQGLGEDTPQYRRAVELGRQVATLAAQHFGNRLINTGHSLGGGLASCAAIAARVAQPDLVMRSVTFNAAGLHRHQAQRAGGTRSTAGDVPVRALLVENEILSSMQSRSRLVPFLADLLVWGNQSMPSAVAAPTPEAGISPGAMPISRKSYAPQGRPLPVLFTADRQMLDPPMTIIPDIVGLANSVSDVNAFVRSLADFLLVRLSEGDVIGYGEMWDAARGFGAMPAEVGAAIGTAVMESAAPEIHDALNPDLGANDCHDRILEPFVHDLLEDVVTLARSMLASGEYHTFWPCAFTFCMDG